MSVGSHPFGTRVSRLSQGTLLAATAAIVTLHVSCYCVAILMAPRFSISNVFVPPREEEDSTFILDDAELSSWNRRFVGSLELSSRYPLPKRLNFSASLSRSSPPNEEYIEEIQGAERILDCVFEGNTSFCFLDPLFDLHSLRDNETLRVTLNTSEPLNMTLFSRVESSNYHKTLLFIKCVFTPALLLSLVYFSWKIHVNDLYISIPDRCLIVAGISLLLRNIPLMLVVTSPYLALFEPLSRGFLLCSLYLFWLIYTGDKVSNKESWERNSRYYWKEILVIVIFALIYTLQLSYALLPSLQNPFRNHWNASMLSRMTSYVLKLSTGALIVFPLQICLSVRVFRILFLHRRRKELSRRLGWTLIYLYLSSLVTTGDHLLRESLPLHRVREALSDFTSVLLIGNEGFWNLHIISSFILLSRAPPNSGLKNGSPLHYGGERKEFDEVLGLSVYNHFLQDKD